MGFWACIAMFLGPEGISGKFLFRKVTISFADFLYFTNLSSPELAFYKGPFSKFWDFKSCDKSCWINFLHLKFLKQILAKKF